MGTASLQTGHVLREVSEGVQHFWVGQYGAQLLGVNVPSQERLVLSWKWQPNAHREGEMVSAVEMLAGG